MDQENIQKVRASFADVVVSSVDVASLFYERLFALDPSLKQLFSNIDISVQGARLFTTLGYLVKNLDRFEELRSVLGDLAIRHIAYGAKEEHFDVVGKALIQTLALALGPKFDPHLRGLWTQAYVGVVEVMVDAMRRHNTPEQDISQRFAG